MARKAAEPTLAPLPRAWLDLTMPAFRAVIGAAFVAFSSYATVLLVGSDLQAILQDRMSLGIFADRYWLGFALALSFFLGEIYTAERWPRVYRAVLVPDTLYTARQLYPGLLASLIVLAKDPLDLALICGIMVGALLLIAYAAGWSLFGWVLIGGFAGGLVWLVAVFVALTWGLFLLACLVALYLGFIVARFGEVFLFGKRR